LGVQWNVSLLNTRRKMEKEGEARARKSLCLDMGPEPKTEMTLFFACASRHEGGIYVKLPHRYEHSTVYPDFTQFRSLRAQKNGNVELGNSP